MTPKDPQKNLIDRIIEHEGIKKFSYQDTLGYSSIGIGRCIQEKIGKGLSIDECMYLLRNDIADFKSQLSVHKWFIMQDIVRQEALIELAFNMGTANLLKFKRMIAALEAKDYVNAGKELMSSLWAKQVSKERSSDLRSRIETGKY